MKQLVKLSEGGHTSVDKGNDFGNGVAIKNSCYNIYLMFIRLVGSVIRQSLMKLLAKGWISNSSGKLKMPILIF